MLNGKGYLEFCSDHAKRNVKSFKGQLRGKLVESKDLNGSEYEEQVKLVVWLERNKGRFGIKFYAIPNGGYRTPTEAVKLKRTGVSAGVPDLCIPKSKGSYHGLYIELKRVFGGKVSDFQKEWIDYLNKEGYYAIVCNGFEAAKKVIEHYFAL